MVDEPRRTHASPNRNARDEYGRLARIYDPLTGPFLDGIRRRVARLAREGGCSRVLDVCCGTGRQCVFLHREGVDAAGVDLSPAMLAVARSRSPSSVPFFRQDAAELGFADHSFHAAIICLALHEKSVDKREAILREAVRVVRPAGRVFLVDFAPPRGAAGGSIRLGLAAIERLVGREHYANFRSYVAAGGLPGLMNGMPLEPTGEGSRFFAGNIELAAFIPRVETEHQ